MSDRWSELNRPAWEVAPLLLGCLLKRTLNGQELIGKIVETEAYDQSDAASHSYNGRQTPRTEIMFGPPGHAYVYFTYGMHYCMNVVTGQKGNGSAVLIRAIEPLNGQEHMQQLRGKSREHELTNGPAKLCQALSIDKSLNGHDMRHSPLEIVLTPPLRSNLITQTGRIGISQAKDTPWRFYITGNEFVSKARV